MGWTAPRILKNATVAAAHQTAFGSAASTSGSLVRAQCYVSAFQREASYIDPQGTHGSEFPRDTHTEVAVRGKATLRFYVGSRSFLSFILEHATHGQPIATLANTDLSETGDTGSDLSLWTFAGVRPGLNTSSDFKLYVKLTDENPGAGQALVQVYSDSARTALVASGSAANSATITLAEQNSSGLSGTVALAAPSASNLTFCYLTILRIRSARAAQIARYFTLWRDSGSELETLTDCAVESLKFTSQENGPLQVEAVVIGTYAALAATALTPSLAAADREYFSHSATAWTHNSIAQSVISLSHGIKHAIEQSLANAAAPVAIYKTGSDLLPIEALVRFASEGRAIIDDGIAGTWRAQTIVYTCGAKTCTVSYPRTKCVDSQLPETAERAWEDHRLAFAARDDGTNDPVSFTLDL